jgi:hypothetical protein
MLERRDTEAAAGFLCRSLGRVIGCLDGLTPDEATWHPPADSANSLLTIAWHTLNNAEENISGFWAVPTSIARPLPSLMTADSLSRWFAKDGQASSPG